MTLLAMKKKHFHYNKCQEIENASKDPLLFWKTLQNIADDLNIIENGNKNRLQPNEWLTHFETLHSEHKLNQKHKEILEDLKNHEKTKDKDPS